MINLEQIRAAAALKATGDLDKSALNKLPAMILGNGLLATVAFCHAESSGDSRGQMQKALGAAAGHLAARSLLAASPRDLRSFAEALSQMDSHQLQRATAETLAFIGYLRRFAQKKKA